jgi:P-type E1-E2 ATPase
MTTFLDLFIEAISDSTLIILMCAAVVSLVIEMMHHPDTGWIDGTAILIAVFLVSMVTSCNNYSKELQFRALEQSSQQDEKTTVIRNGGVTSLVNPSELVVGDIILLQVGDSIPADAIVCDNNVVKSSESSLTGEPEDLKKHKGGDCFLLSSCLITEGESVKAIVIGIGAFSQWGKIKATLVGKNENTPLQEKLEVMAGQIGQIGLVFAILTFIASVIGVFVRPSEYSTSAGIINAFILSVVIVVVAIPEGLPLAVTISLAYSTGKMYDQNCNIR